MQHARVALYQCQPGKADEAISKGQSGMLPTFRSQPGFVGYGLVKTGEDTVLSISVWQSAEQANAAVQVAASWIRENIAELVVSVQNHVGDLVFFSSTSTLGS